MVFIGSLASLFFLSQPGHADWPSTLGQYPCIEIARFDRGGTTLDDDALRRIQAGIIYKLTKKEVVPHVRSTDNPCTERALFLIGTVMKYKGGNWGKAFVPFQGGKAKSFIDVQASIMEKGTGAILAQKLVKAKDIDMPMDKEKYVPVEDQLAGRMAGFVKKGE